MGIHVDLRQNALQAVYDNAIVTRLHGIARTQGRARGKGRAPQQCGLCPADSARLESGAVPSVPAAQHGALLHAG